MVNIGQVILLHQLLNALLRIRDIVTNGFSFDQATPVAKFILLDRELLKQTFLRHFIHKVRQIVSNNLIINQDNLIKNANDSILQVIALFEQIFEKAEPLCGDMLIFLAIMLQLILILIDLISNVFYAFLQANDLFIVVVEQITHAFLVLLAISIELDDVEALLGLYLFEQAVDFFVSIFDLLLEVIDFLGKKFLPFLYLFLHGEQLFLTDVYLLSFNLVLY